jgi:hypothetical protein
MAKSKRNEKRTRFTLVSDNSGHYYSLPVDEETDFYEWLDDEERSTYTESSKYDHYRIEVSRLTFTDPKCE